jgi:hypothetical protein
MSEIDPLAGTPQFPIGPVQGPIDVVGNNAFFQNLNSGGFSTSVLRIYEYFHSSSDYGGVEIDAGSTNSIAPIPGGTASRPLQIVSNQDITVYAGSPSWIFRSSDGGFHFTNGGTFYSASGVPAAGLGSNGDYYFRTDTPATVNQRIYVKSAGTWTGIL